VATGTAQTRFIHPDHLGSANVVTNASGTVVQTLDYYPYGATRISTNTGGADSARKYIGQFADSSGLDYLNARYYSSDRGQFISEDPASLVLGDLAQVAQVTGRSQQQFLSDPQALNFYSYSRGNPIRYNDPKGLWYKEFITGQQSWPSFQLELGDAPNQLAQDSPSWNYAFNNPLKTGAAVGLVSTAAAITGVDAISAFGAATYPGVGTAYAAKQLVATGVYSTLALGTLGSIPGTIRGLSQANSSKPLSFFPTALSLTFNVGPTYVGGYIGSFSDIFQLLNMLNQGLTNLRNGGNGQSATSQPAPSAKNSASGSNSGTGYYTATLPVDYHSACGSLCR